MKKIMIMSFMLMAVQLLQAKPRDLSQAIQCAERFCPSRNMKLVQMAGNKSIKDAAYYIFSDKTGFVIVGGSDLMPEIIGYSDSEYDQQKMAPGMKAWLEYVEVAAEVLEKNPSRALKRADTGDIEPVEPLLGKRAWGQGEPFDLFCPRDCFTGCVATAVAECIAYYRYPERGTGIAINRNDSTQCVDFSKETYNYDLMYDEDDLTLTQKEHEEVAKLIYHVGVLSDMKYSSYGSSSNSYRALYGLVKHMDYDPYGQFLIRMWFNNEEWEEILHNELYNRRPVVYEGVGGAGWAYGHCFVLDGIDKDGLYHINWGWSGIFDGYYAFELFNPYGYDPDAKGYDLMNSALVQLAPRGTMEEVTYYAPFENRYANLTINTQEAHVGEPVEVLIEDYSSSWGEDFEGYLGIAFLQDNKIIEYDLDESQLMVFLKTTIDRPFNETYGGLNLKIPENLADGTYRVLSCIKITKGTPITDIVVPVYHVLYGEGIAYYCDVENGTVKFYAKSHGNTEVYNAINTLQIDYQTIKKGIFDMSGRQIVDGTKLAPGIYVIDGKKCVVK